MPNSVVEQKYKKNGKFQLVSQWVFSMSFKITKVKLLFFYVFYGTARRAVKPAPERLACAPALRAGPARDGGVAGERAAEAAPLDVR